MRYRGAPVERSYAKHDLNAKYDTIGTMTLATASKPKSPALRR